MMVFKSKCQQCKRPLIMKWIPKDKRLKAGYSCTECTHPNSGWRDNMNETYDHEIVWLTKLIYKRKEAK